MASDDSHARVEIDWLKTLASALAAVSSAVLLSTLGAAGTIIGAALGSVVVTVGSALYSQGLDRSRRLTQAQVAAVRRAGTAQTGRAPVPAEAASPDRSGWRQRLAQLPWKHLALVAAALFAATVVALTAFELAAGRSVASFTGGGGGSGGTTITHLGGGGGSGRAPDQQPTSPSTTTTESPSPGEPTTGTTVYGATPSDATSSGATPFGASTTGVPSPTPSQTVGSTPSTPAAPAPTP
ncbi:hypothetical protein [Nocardioides ungokensis]|uniref:hypothetical protein n=1 Tax=Nocardioides ungokensis TaxID=1643322 RepID=UPI0015DE626E|nr:hypothetical protein [Nocardioides ungokensis]